MAIKLVKKDEEITLLRIMTIKEKLECIECLELNINQIATNLDQADARNIDRDMRVSRGLFTLSVNIDESASTKIDSADFTNLSVDNRILRELLIDQRLLDLWDISRKTIQRLMSRKLALSAEIEQITKIEQGLGETLDDIVKGELFQENENGDGRKAAVIDTGIGGTSQFSDSLKPSSQYETDEDQWI